MICPTCKKEVSIIKKETDEFGKVIEYFSCGHRLITARFCEKFIGLTTIALKKKDKNNNIYEESLSGQTISREGKIMNLQKRENKVNKICKEETILEKEQIRQELDEELVTAKKWIDYLNKAKGKDFILPQHSKKDEGVDAISRSISNPKVKLKIQIVSSDFKARESLGQKGKFTAFRNKEDKIKATIIDPISHKDQKYPLDLKRETILLLNGWWTVTEEDLDYFKTYYPNSHWFLQRAGFREIWFISMKDDGPIYKIYP